MTNLRLAFRSLRRTPLVTTVAVLSLALGVGANAAIFSLFEQMILRPLPVEDPQELVNLSAPGPKSGSQSSSNAGGVEAVFSYPMFRDLEAAQTVFTGLAAHRSFGANLAIGGNTISGEALSVSGSYFEALGLTPALGRLLQRGDDQTPGAHDLVVLAHGYWRDHFGSDPAVVGRSLIVNGRPLTIVGVAPAGFRGTTLGDDPKIFVPISMREALVPGWKGLDDRRSYWIYLFARLAPGVSPEQAAAALNGPYGAILQEVEAELQGGMSESTLERFKNKTITLEPGSRGQSDLHQELGTPLLLLLGVTGFVLLIAAANMVNLLLVKAAHRAGEIAIRLSIGARRYQVVGQLLTESFLLALLGSAAGILVAFGTLRAIGSLLPAEEGPDFVFQLNPVVWLFLLALCLVLGLAGLFPALNSTRQALAASMKRQGGGSSGSRAANRFRAAMVTLQIALSMTLLIAAGLFTKSLVRVSRVDLGLDVEPIATFAVSPELNQYTPAQSRQFFERLEEEIQALPGVTNVAASMVPLISGSNWGSNVSVQGFEADPDTDTHSNFNEVGPDFFRTLGIPLLSGREFERGDDVGRPKVAVVNQAFARKFNLGTEVVGKRMQVGSGGEMDIEIVGLAEDAKYSEVKQDIPPTFFLPYRQDEEIGSTNFYVRFGSDPMHQLAALRRTVAALDPNLPIENLRTLALQVKENILLDRILSLLSAAFALLATLLAAVGLYGVMAFSVARRTREIGLRMALGADAGRVRRLVLGQVGRLTLLGSVLGLAAAFGVGRAAKSLLFELDAHDPLVFLSSTLMIVAISLAAGFLPAHRASTIEPIRALREE